MKIVAWTLAALVCGFIAGIVLSEVIGIVGFLVFHRAVGIRFLPVYLGVISAVVVLAAGLLSRRRV